MARAPGVGSHRTTRAAFSTLSLAPTAGSLAFPLLDPPDRAIASRAHRCSSARANLEAWMLDVEDEAEGSSVTMPMDRTPPWSGGDGAFWGTFGGRG